MPVLHRTHHWRTLDDISNFPLFCAQLTSNILKKNACKIMETVTIPGNKLKNCKSFLQGKISHVQTLYFFWYFVQTFFFLSHLSSAKILDLATAIAGSSNATVRKHKILMASVTYGPSHFVVLFLNTTAAMTAHNLKNTKSEAL